VDPKSGRKVLAIVEQTEAQLATNAGAPDVIWLDLADADFIPLPPGVSIQMIADTSHMGATAPDRYFGFNTRGVDAIGAARTSTVPFGGVILFDGNGQLVSTRYGLRCIDSNGVFTALGGILNVNGFNQSSIGIVPASGGGQLPRSQFGVVLFEQELFASNSGTDPDRYLDGAALTPAEPAEETWLDQNSTPVLVNRYTGTLITEPK
jgi:hypothetical protein